jgi:serine protease Do
MKKQKTIWVWALLLCLLSFNNAHATLTAEEKQAITQIKAFNTAFKALAREVTPSVVTINVISKVDENERRSRRISPFGFPIPEEEAEPERESTGSGIIMTSNGYILTNHHVAGKADKLTVRLSDNREFDAELVGSDQLTDIAVIKVDATDLKPAQVGQSDKVKIGEWVLAVGAPLNLESTVTSGIVSAIGRDINILQDQTGLSIEDFIQTDAAVNPGNSGGALVNLDGAVIGVNTAIASTGRSGGFVGYSFAVPIDLAKKVMDDIIEYGEVKRGILGVELREVTSGTAEAYGLDRPKGVLIGRVILETPAEKAGLKADDIILSVDGQEVNRPNQLQSIIGRKRPDDTITLGIFRRGKNRTITATLTDKIPEDMQQTTSHQRPEKSKEISEIGITVQDITPELSRQAGLPKDIEGVLVTDASRQARRAGFIRGDVIQSVLQYPIEIDIRSVKDFEDALTKLKKGRSAIFHVKNGGRRRPVEIRIPQ